jgi:hypothetical protein
VQSDPRATDRPYRHSPLGSAYPARKLGRLDLGLTQKTSFGEIHFRLGVSNAMEVL